MKRQALNQEDIYLLFEIKRESWGSVYLSFRPVHLRNKDNGDQQVISAYVNEISGDLDCQAMLDKERKELITWDFQYHTFSVNRRVAEEYHQSLSKIGKVMDKLNSKWGIPETFGDFVTRFANAIGVVGYLKRNKPRYEIEGYTVGDANDSKYWIKNAVYNELNPEKES